VLPLEHQREAHASRLSGGAPGGIALPADPLKLARTHKKIRPDEEADRR
jgi:hypothetical protein